jgi:glycosyltransferase, family 2
MEQNPLVSVIINCFNGEKYLREAIDSVINQTYQNWEIIFWDNQSTDSTAEIVKSYNDERIHYIFAPKHTPLGEARNLAVEKSNGEYINFLDADDVWTEKKLEKQIRLIEPGITEVVYTGFDIKFEGEIIDDRMRSYYEKVKKRKCPSDMNVYQFLLLHNYIIFSSVLFNKKLYLNQGGVDCRFNQNEDYDILLKCSLKTNLKSTNDEDVIYRIHSSNNSKSSGDAFIKENRIIFSSLPNSVEVKNAITRNEIRYSLFLFRYGNKLNAIMHLLKFLNIHQLFILSKIKRGVL